MADGGGDYFSIDAVLAEETAVPCSFQCGAQGIGRALDASSGATTPLRAPPHTQHMTWGVAAALADVSGVPCALCSTVQVLAMRKMPHRW